MTYNTKVVLAYFKDCGLPEPDIEYQFAWPRRWKFDFSWRKLALEVEGAVWIQGRHTRGSGFVKDMEKYNEAAARGYRIIRVQPKDLCTQETVDLIKRCLS